MLTRIAGNCYWLARYLERAENAARLLRMAEDHACRPEGGDRDDGLWSTALEVGGSLDDYLRIVGAIEPAAVVRYMAMERENSSSIVACLRAVRDNARSARHLLPDLLWESANDAWLEAQALDDGRITGVDGLTAWTTRTCRLIAGCCEDLWRDTVPHVLALGRSVERADHLARLLAELLPRLIAHGRALAPGTPGCRLWHSLLAGSGMAESWRRLHAGALEPVAALHLVLLHPTAPHSMLVSVRLMADAIRGFAPGRAGRALETAREIQARLIATDLGVVVGAGLQAFCRDITDLTNRLGAELQRDHFAWEPADAAPAAMRGADA